MGAAEARALWQRRASRCFLVREEDTTMPPRLACCHHQHHQQQQHSSSSTSASFGDSSDFSSDTKWWLKGSSSFDEEITNSFLQDTKLHLFVDLTTGISKEEDYSFIIKKDLATTPWWRSTTDQDELALFVATRSVDHHIQNCDLPPPHKLHKSIHCTSSEKRFQTAVNSPWKQGPWSDRFERSLSYSSSCNSTDSKNMSPKSSPKSDDLSSKAQLLEALRHSQTRAREAEEAAKEACAEKDRLVAILMRQASQILAYKQWIKLLEMEALYLQMKREEEEEEQEQVVGMNLKKRKQRGKKNKNKKMGEIGRDMMAFALGFSLIGAGLLLGWTVGWLFPF